MIGFGDMSRRKTDLVAVGRVSCGCRLGDLTLRKLAFQGIFQCGTGITAAGITHCLVYEYTS